MAGDIVVVTGARKGIGRAVAEHALARGHRVVGCSRGPSDLAHEDYHHECLDVASEADVQRLFARVRTLPGRLRAVVNNAGVAAMNHALLTPASTLRRVFETNVYGTFLFCREAARLLRGTPHARIVNVSTVAVPLALEGESVYAASKAAVEMLTRVLAKELGAFGITCNAVGPGPVRTGLIEGVPPDKIDRILQSQAVRRLTTTADVVNVIDFFLRPESDMVTGQVVYLGGVG